MGNHSFSKFRECKREIVRFIIRGGTVNIMTHNIIFVVSKSARIVFITRIEKYGLSYSIVNFTITCYYTIRDL